MVESTCFPRGKPQRDEKKEKSLKKRKQSDSKDNDVLFGKRVGEDDDESEKKPKKKSKKAFQDQRNAANAAAAEAAALENESVDTITLKTLKKGVMLLGCIRQIQTDRLFVSLPNNLFGIVQYEDAADEYQSTKDISLASAFKVGQYVPCVVESVTKEKSQKCVNLSLRASVVNSGLRTTGIGLSAGMTVYGSIKSIEDHGVLVNVGIKGVTGFIAKSDEKLNNNFVVGASVFCSVKSVNTHTKIVTLVTDHDTTVKNTTRGDQFTLKSLTPGMLFNVRVKKVLKNGLRVTFLSFFEASVSQDHLSTACVANWAECFSTKTKARARIIGINFAEKVVILSMAPHVVHLASPVFQNSVGENVSDVVIHRIDHRAGLLLSLGSVPAVTNDDDTKMKVSSSIEGTSTVPRSDFKPAYVKIGRTSDDEKPCLKKFKVGDVVKNCRILATSLFDGISLASMEDSLLSQDVIRFEDLVAGMDVSGKISSVRDIGIFLDLGSNIRGLVPAMHCPPSFHKCKVGKNLKAKVLSVNSSSKKMFLTTKAALINSTLPILSSFEEATVNTIVQGYVTKISSDGLIISFYNNTFGLVPVSVLRDAGVDGPLSKSYAVGQVVKACVVSCNPSRKRMSLTLDISKGVAIGTELNDPSSSSSCPIGTVVPKASVIEVSDGFLRLKTVDGGYVGVLSTEHLSDFSHNAVILNSIIAKVAVVGNIIENVKVIDRRSDGFLTFTLKETLVNIPKNMSVPQKLSDCAVGMTVVGVITSTKKSVGAFVRFMGDVKALIPMSSLSSKYTTDPLEVVSPGMTVHAVLTEVDHKASRCIASLVEACAVQNSLYISKLIADSLPAAGSIVKATVLALKPYGTVVSFTSSSSSEDNESVSSALLSVKDTDQSTLSEGSELKIRLLDFDSEKGIWYASSRKEIVKKKNKTSFGIGKKVSATVVCANESYAVAALDNTGTLALIQVADYQHPLLSCEDAEISVGSEMKVKVLELPSTVTNNVFYICARANISAPSSSKCSKAYGVEELVKSAKVQVVISQIQSHQMYAKIRMAPSISSGRVDTAICICNVDPVKDSDNTTFKNPFTAYSVGQVVTATIKSIQCKRENELDSSSAINYRKLQLSLRSDDDDSESPLDSVVSGQKVCGTVVEVGSEGVFVQLSETLRGYCHAIDLSSDINVLKSFTTAFSVGTPVNATILDVVAQHKITLRVRSDSSSNLSKGSTVVGMINRNVTKKSSSLMIQLSGKTFASVSLTHLTPRSEWENFPLDTAKYNHGTMVQAVVLKVADDDDSESGPVADLSLRSDDIKNVVNDEQQWPAEGDLVQGYVKSTTTSGCFVLLDHQKTGRILIRDLADKFIKSPKESFPPGMLIAARVMTVDREKNQIRLSLKTSEVCNDESLLRLQDLKEGMHVKGTVTTLKEYGVFVKLEKSNNISGLCHISEMADTQVKDATSVFSVGDYVKARVLKLEGRRLALGLKPSYFEHDEESEDESSSEEEEGETDSEEMQVVEAAADSDEEDVAEAMDVDSSDSEDDNSEDDNSSAAAVSDEDDDSDDYEEESSTKKVTTTTASNDSVGMTWSGFEIEEENEERSSDSESDDDDTVSTQKLSKKKQEEITRTREISLMKGEAKAETAEDFERLLIASPNNALLWINYMSFHLSMADVKLARNVAEKALKTISFRNEKDKMNVWKAMMNLEHQYGDDESLRQVFQRSTMHNTPKDMYFHLLGLYEEAKQESNVDMTLKTMRKKFKGSQKVWLAAMKHELSRGKSDDASALLQQSLKSLDKHKHVGVISKFAQLEYELGSIDRARTIFEGILSNYPKRLDLWNVYLDKEIKFGSKNDPEMARKLFKRLVHLKFSSKKMKFVFKKYLQFEMDHGTSKHVEAVNQLVRDFVENAS